MKKILLYILSIALVFVCCDLFIGLVYRYKFSCINSTLPQKQYYLMMKHPEYDVLILGSSNAACHFNSNIIEDSLNMSTFNAAEGSTGMLYQKAVFDCLTKENPPKIVILGINDALIGGVYDDVITDYCYLYGKSPEMTEAINEVLPPLSRIKYISAACRYNHVFWVRKVHKGQGSDPLKGFTPQPEGDGIIELSEDWSEPVWKEKDRDAFIHMLEASREKGIQMIVCETPSYTRYTVPDRNSKLRQLVESYGMQFIDYTNDEYYLSRSELFHDNVHLNSTGADIFTRDVIGKISSLSQNKSLVLYGSNMKGLSFIALYPFHKYN